MSEKDTGGAAFPSLSVFTDRDGEVCSQQIAGMNLRDYFAAQALQGVLATINDFGKNKEDVFKTLSVFSYMMADAMLEARK